MQTQEIIAHLKDNSLVYTLAQMIINEMRKNDETATDIVAIAHHDNLGEYLMVAPTDRDNYSFEDWGFQIYTHQRVYSSLVSNGQLKIISLPLKPGAEPVSIFGSD